MSNNSSNVVPPVFFLDKHHWLSLRSLVGVHEYISSSFLI
jgi:hypothetical protein